MLYRRYVRDPLGIVEKIRGSDLHGGAVKGADRLLRESGRQRQCLGEGAESPGEDS